MLPIVEHPTAAKEFVTDPIVLVGTIKHFGLSAGKRDKQAASIPEWEYLRETASQIKTHTIANLDRYLMEFEENATPAWSGRPLGQGCSAPQ